MAETIGSALLVEFSTRLLVSVAVLFETAWSHSVPAGRDR